MSIRDQLRYRLATFSIVEKIILANVIFFVLPMLLNVFFFLFRIQGQEYLNWLQLSSHLGTFVTRPWTLVSYSFLHSGFFHLLWNMVLLYYSGRLLLNLFPNWFGTQIVRNFPRLIHFLSKFHPFFLLQKVVLQVSSFPKDKEYMSVFGQGYEKEAPYLFFLLNFFFILLLG